MKHQKLINLKACSEAQEFAEKFDTLQQAWDACEIGSWMLWYLYRICGRVNTPGHRRFTACKCVCARLVLYIFEGKYPEDKRPRKAIAAAEQYASSSNDYASAYAAADASAYAAIAADADAADAAAAAAYAAAVAAADYATAVDASAADAAAVAAYADATAVVAAAAKTEMLKQCADEIRKIWPTI
jgi:hypothetical protein